MQLYIKAGREYIEVEDVKVTYDEVTNIFLGSKDDLVRAAGIKVLDGVEKSDAQGDRVTTYEIQVGAKVYLVYAEPKEADYPCPVCGVMVYTDEAEYWGFYAGRRRYERVCKECGEVASKMLVPCAHCHNTFPAGEAVEVGYKYAPNDTELAFYTPFHSYCAKELRDAAKKQDVQAVADGESGQGN